MHPLAFLLLLLGATPATAAEPVGAALAPAPGLPTGDTAEVRARLQSWAGSPEAQAATALEEPVALRRLSSRFGLRVDPVRGGWRRHEGVDVPGLAGTPVRAAADGVVLRARTAGGYGNLIEIDHGTGLETRYAHLSRIAVAPGETVRQGELIGLMGSTGRSTGSHLHFEVRQDGRPADPLEALAGGVMVPAARPERPVEAHWRGWSQGADHLPGAEID